MVSSRSKGVCESSTEENARLLLNRPRDLFQLERPLERGVENRLMTAYTVNQMCKFFTWWGHIVHARVCACRYADEIWATGVNIGSIRTKLARSAPLSIRHAER